MSRRLFLLVLPALLACIALPSFGQNAQGGQAAPCRIAPCKPASPPLPYTAQFKTTHVQTLANGTNISRITTNTQARDSQGRTLFSNTTEIPVPNGTLVTTANVNDRTGGMQSNWNSQTQKAHVIKLPPADQRTGCWRTESGSMTMHYGPVRPAGSGGGQRSSGSIVASVLSTVPPAGTGGDVSSGVVGYSVPLPDVPANQVQRPQREDLGTSMIEGVEAHGYRLTTTIPTGKIGNDQPIVNTTEYWMAPSLGLELRSISDNPQSGKSTREVISLELGEPDPALFQPPEGYEVTTEEMIPCKE